MPVHKHAPSLLHFFSLATLAHEVLGASRHLALSLDHVQPGIFLHLSFFVLILHLGAHDPFSHEQIFSFFFLSFLHCFLSSIAAQSLAPESRRSSTERRPATEKRSSTERRPATPAVSTEATVAVAPSARTRTTLSVKLAESLET